MNLKRYDRYQIVMTDKWMKASLLCMGMAVLCLAVYYLLWLPLAAVKAGILLLGLILPMLLLLAYIVLGRMVRLNAPGVYAILGAMLCLWLMAMNILGGGILRILLSVIWYAFSAWILIFCAGGYLPGRLPGSVVFSLALFVRLIVFDLPKLRSTNWLKEGAVLLVLLGLYFLPKAFKSVREK